MSDTIQCGGLIERRDLSLIEILGYKWRAGRSSRILTMFAEHMIPLCYLALGGCAADDKQLALCVESRVLPNCRPILDAVANEFAPRALAVTEDVVVLTLYGPHFYERVALASEVYAALCGAEINAHSAGSSVNSISFVIDSVQRDAAIAALRTRFVWPE